MLFIIFSGIQMSCALFTKMDLVSVEKKTQQNIKKNTGKWWGGGVVSPKFRKHALMGFATLYLLF